jgi:hypothetical protein
VCKGTSKHCSGEATPRCGVGSAGFGVHHVLLGCLVLDDVNRLREGETAFIEGALVVGLRGLLEGTPERVVGPHEE